MSLVDRIKHYQRNIEKCDDDEDKVVHYISKLCNLPITVQHLQETGVGRTINALRKYDGGIGDAAKALVAKWKAMVASEGSSGEDEDEACVPDAPDSYSDLESSKLEENPVGSEGSEKQVHKSEKSEVLYTSHNNKCTSKHESKLKSVESQPKSNNDIAKNSNSDLEKHKKHDKTKDSHRHESRSDRRSSKDTKSLSKKDETPSSKHTSNREKHSNKSVDNSQLSKSNEETYKKRKHDDSHMKKDCKRRKQSDSENDETKSHVSSTSEKHTSISVLNSVKIKEECKEKDALNKNEIKHVEKKDSHERLKSSSKSKDLVKTIKQEINGDEGIDCHSGATFAEALGMCTMAQTSKKRNSNTPSTNTAKMFKGEQSATSNKKTVVKSESTSGTLQTPSLLTTNVKLEPLNVDLASTLPEISPNYKPLPYVNPVHRKEEDKTLTDVMYIKNQRTKVYSGNKSGYTTVPTLFEICIRVLIENIDALEFTGGVPFDIIKPVLERATADQLFMLEHHNPYLVEDTDKLWQFHCNREFRNKQREEMETWREMYMRCLDEREAKLKTLTANIKQSIDKSVPVRSTKLAYVDNIVKPPRNILKKQAKYGTANSAPKNSTSTIKQKLINGGGSKSATNISVPPPPIQRAKPLKKTKAPLMAKALQLIKGRYKR
ncbi:Transcription elongation factor B polypeptide 3 [Melipona quadrifasciata]|uniref:Transcription elongation factor B polypeptide 3 n=1 Tax=Melipona quadrifasciata TaxID=166423 RepID=A0A0M9A8M3_9HYME|nr:Transcription elongation factor B polypeptide 3 [Melipona quadrifasciata]